MKCNTHTFIFRLVTSSENSDYKLVPGSVPSTFKNRVMLKKNKVCMSIYTNMTLQIVGLSNIEDASTFAAHHLHQTIDYEYEIDCVMGNWAFKLSENINLNVLMEYINTQTDNVAYFMRSSDLIVKIKQVVSRPTYVTIIKQGKLEKLEYKCEKPQIKPYTAKIYKTGNCILSAPTIDSANICVNFLKGVVEKV